MTKQYTINELKFEKPSWSEIDDPNHLVCETAIGAYEIRTYTMIPRDFKVVECTRSNLMCEPLSMGPGILADVIKEVQSHYETVIRKSLTLIEPKICEWTNTTEKGQIFPSYTIGCSGNTSIGKSKYCCDCIGEVEVK